MSPDILTELRNEFHGRVGSYSDIHDHLEFMYDTVRKYSRPVIIEMGVRCGNSTSALLLGAAEQGGQLWSVDIGEAQVPAYWHDLPFWNFRQDDSVSPETLDWMPRQADVVFMDTSHTFEQQLAELRAYVPRVVPGGTVLLHDTECVPADDFQSDSFRPMPGPEGPVTDALNAFCGETGLSWYNRHSEPNLYGMGVIVIPGGGDE